MLDTVLGAPLIVSSCGPRNGMVGRTGAILCEDGAGTVYAVRVTATRGDGRYASIAPFRL